MVIERVKYEKDNFSHNIIFDKDLISVINHNVFNNIVTYSRGFCTRSSQYEFESNHYAGPLVHIVCCSTPSIMLFSSDYWLPTTSCPPHSNIDCFTNVFPCGV